VPKARWAFVFALLSSGSCAARPPLHVSGAPLGHAELPIGRSWDVNCCRCDVLSWEQLQRPASGGVWDQAWDAADLCHNASRTPVALQRDFLIGALLVLISVAGQQEARCCFVSC
jgi:hypothetical protein